MHWHQPTRIINPSPVIHRRSACQQCLVLLSRASLTIDDLYQSRLETLSCFLHFLSVERGRNVNLQTRLRFKRLLPPQPPRSGDQHARMMQALLYDLLQQALLLFHCPRRVKQENVDQSALRVTRDGDDGVFTRLCRVQSCWRRRVRRVTVR